MACVRYAQQLIEEGVETVRECRVGDQDYPISLEFRFDPLR
jgi:hypothetical protein